MALNWLFSFVKLGLYHTSKYADFSCSQSNYPVEALDSLHAICASTARNEGGIS